MQAGIQRPDRYAKLSSVRSFAEALLLCPSEEAAQSLIARDRPGAAGFCSFGLRCLEAMRLGWLERLKPPLPDTGPFYESAALILDYVDGYQKQYPDET